MNFFEEVREYLRINHEAVTDSLVQHIWLALLPVAIAFVLSLPIGWAVVRFGWVRHPILTLTSIIYTIPSLALLLLLPGILHTSFLDPLNVVVALTIYAVAIMVRGAADAFGSVSPDVLQSATAMGNSRLSRFFTVQLPLAGPVLLANLRVVSVSTISLLSVGAIIGNGGLGYLFTNGYQRDFPEQVLIGIVAILLLALLFDIVLSIIGRVLMPWSRVRGARRSRRSRPLTAEVAG